MAVSSVTALAQFDVYTFSATDAGLKARTCKTPMKNTKKPGC